MHMTERGCSWRHVTHIFEQPAKSSIGLDVGGPQLVLDSVGRGELEIGGEDGDAEVAVPGTC